MRTVDPSEAAICNQDITPLYSVVIKIISHLSKDMGFMCRSIGQGKPRREGLVSHVKVKCACVVSSDTGKSPL
jgi:hypothetical protein